MACLETLAPGVENITEPIIFDQEWDWEPKRDEKYYGDIPPEVTKEALVDIMVTGLKNYMKDVKENLGKETSIDEALYILDTWFDHDENHADLNKFHHLVPEEDSDTFFATVSQKLKKYSIPSRFKSVTIPKNLPVRYTTSMTLSLANIEAYYIKDFLPKAEADRYFTTLLSNYPFHQEQTDMRIGGEIKTFDQPRLTRFMGDPNKSYYYSGYERSTVPWIPEVLEIRDKIMKFIYTIHPDHPLLTAVLGNLYRDGKDYIGNHSDDETDLTENAMIASISLGSERDFDIFDKKTTKRFGRVNLAHGSLFIMGKNFQAKLKHGLPKRLKIKTPRINLTFRSLQEVE